MFGLLHFLRNIALRYAKKRNCLFLKTWTLTFWSDTKLPIYGSKVASFSYKQIISIYLFQDKTHITATAYGLLTKFLTLDYPILWAGIEWKLLREICVSSRRQQLLPPRGSKFRVVMARCQNL